MTFKDAVEMTPELDNTWRSGLRALSVANKRHVEVDDPRQLRGSVDVESALKSKYPNDPQWDYAVGHCPTNRNGEEVVYWIEIHPATSGEVKVVLAKLTWLKNWLQTSAPDLRSLRKRFIWISSGKTAFTLTSPQQKQFANLGLSQQGRMFRIPNTF